MPISKRINNLTLTSQNLSEHETPTAQNANQNEIASNHFMAINNQEIQTQHFAQQSLLQSYPNTMSAQHYGNHDVGQSAQHLHQPPHFHQSHIVQSTNHSNGFHNGSHLAIGTNSHHKPNQQQMHHHHHQQQQQQQHHPHHPQHSHQSTHAEPNNNNQMEDVYSPELTADENPFYYDKNKLLFDLHVERQRRHQSQ